MLFEPINAPLPSYVADGVSFVIAEAIVTRIVWADGRVEGTYVRVLTKTTVGVSPCCVWLQFSASADDGKELHASILGGECWRGPDQTWLEHAQAT